MEEYIFYVILIFIPIGGAMAYLLRKDGLPMKYINIIVILSLLIIITFPICVERLGGLASLMIYVLVITVMFWYILRVRVGHLALFTSRSLTGEQLIDNLLTDEIPIIPVTNTTLENDEAYVSETVEENPEKEESSEEKVSHKITPEEKKEEAIMAEVEMETDEGLETESTPLDLPVVADDPACREDLTPEKLEITPEQDAIAESVAPVSERIPEKDVNMPAADAAPAVSPEELPGEDYLPEEAVGNEGITLLMDKDDKVELSAPETVESIFVMAETDKTAETEETLEPLVEKQDFAPIPVPDSSEPEKMLTAPIMELIDNGFACRDSNKAEAASYFEDAWHTTSEYDLRYMLTMELLAIYKECGWYNKAGSILNSFSSLPGHKSDIINEINRQIDYISLLAAELERLGISDFPISKVPRWVRLKVDGEMNP